MAAEWGFKISSHYIDFAIRLENVFQFIETWRQKRIHYHLILMA